MIADLKARLPCFIPIDYFISFLCRNMSVPDLNVLVYSSHRILHKHRLAR